MLKMGELLVLFVNTEDGIGISTIENVMIDPILTHRLEIYHDTIKQTDTDTLTNILESEHLEVSNMITTYGTYLNDVVDLAMNYYGINSYAYPQRFNVPEPFIILDETKPYNFIIF